jgi:hypothetical protein
VTTSIDAARPRSEPRVVRPYSGLSLAERLFRDQIRLAIDGEKRNDDHTVHLDANSLAEASFELHLECTYTELCDAVGAANLAEVDTELLVIVRSRTLAVSKVVSTYGLSSDHIPKVLPLNRSTEPLAFGDKNGFDITIGLVLVNGVQPRRLKPYIPGTWLAKKDFRIRPIDDGLTFNVQPLTDSIRSENGLPAECLTWMPDVDPDELLEAEAVSDVLALYVDDAWLGWLNADPNSDLSVFQQTQLLVDLLVLMVSAINGALKARDATDAAGIAEHEGVSRTLISLGARIEKSPEELLEIADSSPALLVSHMQAAVRLKTTAKRAAK